MPNHERIDQGSVAAASEWDTMEPQFPGDPNQYTEAELQAEPAKRYRVDPEKFPIFSQQGEYGPKWGDGSEYQPLDETMARYVQATADTIAVIAGEDEGFNDKKIPAADHVIYLDKSARPVSWLVNVFWDEFSDKKRPDHSYLAIDRKEWFGRTDTPVEPGQYIREPNDELRLATFKDFRKENVTREHLARIRALFVPGGINTEDIDEIMRTPTRLNGKNITIIDEVSRSGSTLEIAKYLVSQAIPEAAGVNGYAFWHAGVQYDDKTGQTRMRSAPVWYDVASNYGRGIGDVDEAYFQERYEKYPNPKTRAQKFGSFALGSFVDLADEPGNRSRELAREIKNMRKEWDAGHIFMFRPEHYSWEKWQDHLRSQGVQFAPAEKNRPIPKNNYLFIERELKNRPATPFAIGAKRKKAT